MAGKKNLISYFRLGWPLCISTRRVSIIKPSAVHNLPCRRICMSLPCTWKLASAWNLAACAGRIPNEHSTLASQLSRGILSGYKSKLRTHKQDRFISILPLPFHCSSLCIFLFHFSLFLHYFLQLETAKGCNNRRSQIFNVSKFGKI